MFQMLLVLDQTVVQVALRFLLFWVTRKSGVKGLANTSAPQNYGVLSRFSWAHTDQAACRTHLGTHSAIHRSHSLTMDR